MNAFFKKRVLPSFAVLLFALSPSCSKPDIPQSSADPIILQPQTRAILGQTNSFAFDLFSTISQQSQTNLFLSPYSVSGVLGMLYNGAAGETKEEIAAVLGMSDYSPQQVNAYYSELTKALLKVDTKTTLSLANAIWAKKGYSLRNNFVALNKEYYDAEVSTLDFSQASSLKTINDWCNKQTKGTIPKIVDNIDPSTVVILANAIYFKSLWTDKFDKANTTQKPFHNYDGSSSSVPMMHQKPLKLRYAQMDDCGMVTLPYSNKAFAMNLILPDENADIETLIAALDGDLWQTMIAHRESVTVTLSMPRFKVENKIENLPEILSTLGMPLAFNPLYANFSDMMDMQTYISKMIQKSYISVDESGTEAAAVTVAFMEKTSAPNPQKVTMVFDRPFIYLITEQSTGAILFMGKVTKL